MNTYEDFLNLVRKVTGNNFDAERFVCEACEAIHFWDDLIDKDKPLDDDEINNALDGLFFRLPMNSFYKQYEYLLHPILMASIYNWQAATRMERNPQNDNDLYISYILRSSCADLLSICAVIIHGKKKSVDLICEIRRYWHSEGFANYIQNLIQEKAARG